MYRIYSIRNWIFIAHRVTGVALLVYFVAHVLTISTALLAGPEAFTAVMATLAKPAFRVVELLVAACILFHGLNGLHVIASERGWLRRAPRPAAAAATAAAVTGALALVLAVAF